MGLIDFDALSFDCYGTLIDWEAGIAAVLEPWARRRGIDIGVEELLERYAKAEEHQERETPAALYPDILAAAMHNVGQALGATVSRADGEHLAISVGDWPAFPNSPAALAALRTAIPAGDPFQRRSTLVCGKQRAPRGPIRCDHHCRGCRLVQAVGP